MFYLDQIIFKWCDRAKKYNPKIKSAHSNATYNASLPIHHTNSWSFSLITVPVFSAIIEEVFSFLKISST